VTTATITAALTLWIAQEKKELLWYCKIEKWLWKLWPIFCCTKGSGWPCSSLQTL